MLLTKKTKTLLLNVLEGRKEVAFEYEDEKWYGDLCSAIQELKKPETAHSIEIPMSEADIESLRGGKEFDWTFVSDQRAPIHCRLLRN